MPELHLEQRSFDPGPDPSSDEPLRPGPADLDPDDERLAGIPRPPPRWFLRVVFAVADVIGWPLLGALRLLVTAVGRARSLVLARYVALGVARLLRLETFRRNLRVILDRPGDRGCPGRPEGTPVPVQALVERSAVHHLQTIVDLVAVLDRKQAPIEAVVEAEGEHHLVAARAHGRGVVLVSSHTGNWELGAAWIASRGHPLNVVYHQQPSVVLDRYFRTIRTSCGARILPQRRGLKAAVQALRRNELLALVADQDGTSSGLFLDFFGLLVSMPRGPVYLAVRHRCPIVHTYSRRLDDGRYRQVFSEPMMPPPADEPGAEAELGRRLLAQIEAVVREDPPQWLLAYDRFKLRHAKRLAELGLLDRALEEQRWIQAGID